MAQQISSKEVTTGYNADITSYRDSRYVHCARCGYPLNVDRHNRANFGSHAGEGAIRTAGTDLANGETAWTASSNVTCTSDTTTYYKGTASAKMAIGADFTTGLAAYIDLSSTIDMTFANRSTAYEGEVTNAKKTVQGWFYTDTELSTKDEMRLRLSESTSAGTGATYAEYSIPSLAANTWTLVTFDITNPVASDGGSYPDDFDALASVGLVVQTDNGAVNIYIDDLKIRQPAVDLSDGCPQCGIYTFHLQEARG